MRWYIYFKIDGVHHTNPEDICFYCLLSPMFPPTTESLEVVLGYLE
jgi:hypothetical protein